MKTVKTYEDFLEKPSEESASETKSCVTEKCWESLRKCYETAKDEMTVYHSSKDKEDEWQTER